jgi:hypothetical protein
MNINEFDNDDSQRTLELDLSTPDSPESTKKPTQSPLILENLLKSFFAPEERDLSCDECKVQGSRAKVRTDRWTDVLTDRQSNAQADKQTDRHTQTYKQTGRILL